MPLQPLGPGRRQELMAAGQNPDYYQYDDATDGVVYTGPSTAGARLLQPLAELPGQLDKGLTAMGTDVAGQGNTGFGRMALLGPVGAPLLSKLAGVLKGPAEQLAAVPNRGTILEKPAGLLGEIVAGILPMAIPGVGVPLTAASAGTRRYGDIREHGGSPLTATAGGAIDAAVNALPGAKTAGMPIKQAMIKGGLVGAGANVAGQGAQNVLANETYAPGTPLTQGLGESAALGAGLGGLGSGLHAYAQSKARPIIQMAGGDNLADASAPLQPSQPSSAPGTPNWRQLASELRAGISDPQIRQQKLDQLVASGMFTPDTARQLLPYGQLIDPAEWHAAVTGNAANMAKVGDARQKAAAKLVMEGYTLQPEDSALIQDAFDPAVAVEQIRAKGGPRTAAAKSRAEVLRARMEQEAAQAQNVTTPAEETLLAGREQARAAQEQANLELEQRTQQAAAEMAAQRDAQAAALEQARIDHEAEIAQRTQAAAAQMAAQADAMAAVQAQAKAAGIMLPDSFQSPKDAASYLAERIKLRNAESVKATEQPHRYGPTTAPAGDEILISPAEESAAAMGAQGVDVQPVPEAPKTVKKQLELVAKPDSSKAAALITPGEQGVAPKGTVPVETPRGTAVVNPTKAPVAPTVAKIASETGGKELGMSQPAKPAKGEMVVQTKLADGTVVQDEVVAADGVQAAVDAAKKLDPNVTVTVRPIEEVLRERAEANAGKPIEPKKSKKVIQDVPPPEITEQERANNRAQQEKLEEYLKRRRLERKAASEKPPEPKPSEPVAPKEIDPAEQQTKLRRELDTLESADEAGMLNEKQTARMAELRRILSPKAAEGVPAPSGENKAGLSEQDRFEYHASMDSMAGNTPIGKLSLYDRIKHLYNARDIWAKDNSVGPEPVFPERMDLRKSIEVMKEAVANGDNDFIKKWIPHLQDRWRNTPSKERPISRKEYEKLAFPEKETGSGGVEFHSGPLGIEAADKVMDFITEGLRRARDTGSSVVRRLEGQGQLGREAADALTRLHEEREQYNYRGQALLADAVKGASKSDLLAAQQYMRDMGQFGVSDIKPTASQSKIIQGLKDLALETQALRNKEGPYVREGDKARPGKFDEWYLPQMFKNDVWEKIRQGDPALRDQLMKHMRGQGYSIKEAEAVWRSLGDEKAVVKGDSVDFGPLRKPEGVNYPDDWLQGPAESWVHYLNKWSADMAMSKVIEQDPQWATLRGELDDSRGGRHAAVAGMDDVPQIRRDFQRGLKTFAASISPRLTGVDKLNSLGSAGRVQHISAIRDVMASLPTTWAQTDLDTAVNALTRALSPGSFAEARKKGYIPSFYRSSPEMNTQLASHGVLDTAMKLVDMYRTGTGLHAAQDFTRLMGSFGGEIAAQKALKARDKAFFDRLNIQDPFGRPADQVIAEAANRVQKNVTSSYDARDLPEWLVTGSDNGVMRAIFGLSRFAVGQTNRQIAHMGRALAAGNIRPLVVMLAGGMATTALVDQIIKTLTGHKPSDMTWSEWLNLDQPEAARWLLNQASAANFGGYLTQVAAQLANLGTGVKAYAPRAQAEQLAEDIYTNGHNLIAKIADEGFEPKDLGRAFHEFLKDTMQDYKYAAEAIDGKPNDYREHNVYERLVEGRRSSDSLPSNPLTASHRFAEAETPSEINDATLDIFQQALRGKSVSVRNALREPGYYTFLNKMNGGGDAQLAQDLRRQLGLNAAKREIGKAANSLIPPRARFTEDADLEFR